MIEHPYVNHFLLVFFEQEPDGTVTPYVLPDPDAFALTEGTAAGAPLGALAVRALWQRLCRDELVPQALAEANAIQRRQDTPLAYIPVLRELEGQAVRTCH